MRRPSSVFWLKLLLVAGLVVPALLFALASWENRRSVLREAERTVQTTTAVLHEHAVKVFETHELLFGLIDRMLGTRSWDEIATSASLHAELQALKDRYDQIDSVWLIGPNGVNRAGSNLFPVPFVDVSDRDYFSAQTERNAGIFIDKPSLGRLLNRPQIPVSLRRSTPDGRFDGVIMLGVYPVYFEEFYRRIAERGDTVVGLVRADGAILARMPGLDPAASRPISNGPLMQAVGQHGSGVYRATSPVDGVERIYGYRKLDDYPLVVFYALPVSALLAQWHANLWRYGVVAACASLAMVAFAGLALRRAAAEHRALAQLRLETARREQAEQALIERQRMEALGQLTGGVAHDFNNILTIIGGNLELLRRKIPAGLERQLNAIATASERGAALTRQLLTFARRQTLHPEPLDLRASLPGMVELLRPSLKGDIAVTLALPDDLWPVMVDADEFEVALINVAVNARDAMPSGGRLRIAAENVAVVGQGSVRIMVSDTGHGIPAAILPRVFEPFFTTKPVDRGTGLGLSQVHGFAAQSGGRVDVESREGEGTTVSLLLPRALGSVATASHPSAAGESAVAAAGAVLLVEDDPAVGDAAEAILSELGFTIRRAADAAGALSILTSDDGIDVVVSDIVMPGEMNGLDLARQIRMRWPSLPIVLATGYSAAAQDAPPYPLLQKPYTSAALGRIIAEACARPAASAA